MNMKEDIAKTIKAIKTESVEKSTKKELEKFGEIVAARKQPEQRAKELENTKKVVEEIGGFLAEWDREKSNKPFFDRLRKAGLLEGNVWKGTKLQAGFAAYLFTLAFEDEGNPGKNGKQYDKYYQAIAQFSKFDGINKGTLKRYISYAREEEANGIRYYNHQDEIEAVKNAFK